MPSDGVNSFHVFVDNNTMKLEETYHAASGKTYIPMPFNTYQVEFEEEEPGGGVCRQEWPVTPYQVVAATTSDTHTAATLYVDGHKVHTVVLVPASAGGTARAVVAATTSDTHTAATLYVDGQKIHTLVLVPASAGGNGRAAFKGIPAGAAEERELLFSLPRFVSRREKQRNGGQSLPKEKLEQIGTIRVTFAPTRYGRIETQPANYRIDEGFVQANKKDCAVKGMGQGDDPGKFAASTRAGKSTSIYGQMWTYYCDPQVVGPIVDMAVHYRTQHYLIEHRIIANPHAEEARAEKDKKRAARRKRDHGSQGGGAPADAVA